MELHPPFLTGRLVRLRAPEPADDTLNELFKDHGVRSGLGMPFPQRSSPSTRGSRPPGRTQTTSTS